MTHHITLDDLLLRDGLELRFQLIFNLATNPAQPWAVEALAHGPRGTNFETAAVLFDYIRLKHAEMTADRHCIAQALRAAAELPPELRISLNVHAVTIEKDETFGEFVAAEAKRNGVDPERVILEIVEQSRYWRTSWMRRSVDGLRSLGLTVALDDIGCGYCNYQMIVDLQPEYLKLDRYFIHGCTQENGRKAVLRSIQMLATEVGARVVAEGVETHAELQTVRSFGIGLAQGFALSYPVSIHELVGSLGPAYAAS